MFGWLRSMLRSRMPRACDFCGELGAGWVYPAADASVTVFTPETIEHIDLSGAWWACDACHDSIDRGDRETLTQRAVDHARRGRGARRIDPAQLAADLRKVHDAFFEKRTTRRAYRFG